MMSKKAVKFLPPPSEYKTCLLNVPAHSLILEGIHVIKVSPNGKLKRAYLTLSKDRFTIYVTESKFKADKVGNLSSISRPFLRKVTSLGGSDDEVDERFIDVGSLDRVQKGQYTLRFELARKLSSRNSSPKGNLVDVEKSRLSSFSIIYANEKTSDIIITEDNISRDEVVDTLNELIQAHSRSKLMVGNDVLLVRHLWSDVDKDQNNSINAGELSVMLNRINFSMKKADVDKVYNSFGKMCGLDRNDRRKGLSFEQCVTMLHKIKRDSTWQVKPVRQLWFDLFGEYMNNGKSRTRVSAESFLKKFMWQRQGQSNFTTEDVDALFKRLNRLEYAIVATNLRLDNEHAGKYIDKDRFEAYLVSKDNDIFDPAASKFEQETMTRSLSEYWINSSHNTYLTGDQLQSRSSVEMYMNALSRGCRCLEIDCFDGYRGADGNLIPLVTHGLTITSKILFKDAIHGIKDFLNNNADCYPLILSLEIHCSLLYQDAMAESLISILGESLYIPDEASLYDPLPSPEELKGMVLIKGKRITDMNLESQETYDTESDDDSEISEEHRAETIGSPTKQRPPLRSQESVVTSTTATTSSSVLSPTLSRITTFHGVRLLSFDKNMEKSKDNMLSFDESKARKLGNNINLREGWIKYNQTHLSRIYPSGKRVVSSNFSPITGWSTGSQLMALNFQTSDEARRLNDGRFRQNGQCGYVLKPPSLMGQSIPTQPISLSIKVLCGTCLPKTGGSRRGENIDPYVQVCLYDIPQNGGKEIVTNYYTHHVSRNGFNPIWLQEHSFRYKVQNPDVAILQFSVWDKDVTADAFVGSSSVPISCIREGYRSVTLFDETNKHNGTFQCASLLVEVKMKQKGQQIRMW